MWLWNDIWIDLENQFTNSIFWAFGSIWILFTEAKDNFLKSLEIFEIIGSLDVVLDVM